jgi:hypothetical protein
VRKDYNGLFRVGPSGNPFNTELVAGSLLAVGHDGTRKRKRRLRGKPSQYPAVYGDDVAAEVGPAVSNFYLYDVTATAGTVSLSLNGVVFGHHERQPMDPQQLRLRRHRRRLRRHTTAP